MANTFITTTAVAKLALASLYNQCVMLPLVSRDWENEFVPGRGATVNVRKPATLTATEYNGSTVSAQNITESYVAVVLNHHADVTIAVTSKQLALEITDFQSEVIDPALEAIAQKVDKDILAFRTDITATVGDGTHAVMAGLAASHWADPKVLADVGTTLSLASVPTTNRSAVVDPIIAGEWKKSALFQNSAAAPAQANDALDAGVLSSRTYGFMPYESNNILDNIGVGFHRSAVAFVSRPLPLPMGAAQAATLQYKGIGVRVVYTYNSNTKSDEISLDLLYGVKTMDATRACLIDASGSAGS